MQLESQITQFTSDKVTKAADFDNQISNQQNQINDYKNQLVESDAKAMSSSRRQRMEESNR